MIIHQVVQDRSRLYNVCLLLRQIIKDYETTQVISVYMCIQRIYNPDFFFSYIKTTLFITEEEHFHA